VTIRIIILVAKNVKRVIAKITFSYFCFFLDPWS